MPNVQQIAVVAGVVYWTDGPEDAVMRVSVEGGSSTAIATGQGGPTGIAVDATNVYCTVPNSTTAPGGMESGAIVRMPLDGGTPVTLARGMKLALDGGGGPIVLASGFDYPASIAVDSTSVYWGDLFNGAVMKLTPK